MDETTLLVESLAAPGPTCPLCGEAHPRDGECDPAWRVARIHDPVQSLSAGPRYYVDPEAPARRNR